MSDVKRILDRIEEGDPHAAEQLLPLVYDDLRRLAARKMAQEKPGQTLDATALVHEAYLRLAGSPSSKQGEEPGWKNRAHFFVAAAEAMRRILVERSRKKKSRKRGGGLARRDLHDSQLAAPEVRDDELLALDEALDRLAATDARAAELVKLRYFAGVAIPAAARILDISPRSADRLWTYARAWLHRELHGS